MINISKIKFLFVFYTTMHCQTGICSEPLENTSFSPLHKENSYNENLASSSNSDRLEHGSSLPKKQDRLRILSLDGGGVRGIAEVRILAYIEKETKLPICELFDLIGGTSAGGMLATLLTTPVSKTIKKPKYTAAEICDILLKETQNLFKQTSWGIFRSKYDSNAYTEKLLEYYSSSLMKDSLTDTAVYAYNLESMKMEAITSWDKRNYKKIDAVVATSAAQTYFDAHTAHPYIREQKIIKDKKRTVWLKSTDSSTYTDGGIAANNPTIMLLGNALEKHPHIKQYDVLSIGSGKCFKPIQKEDVQYGGMMTWFRYLQRILNTSQLSVADYYLEQLFNKNNSNGFFTRLNPPLHSSQSKMDNTSQENLNQIILATDQYIHKNKQVFDILIKNLLDAKKQIEENKASESL